MERRLSRQEKLVLFALTEDATRTDSELADRIRMKQPTVGRHRRNLQKNGHVYFVNFPSFHKLGLEFIAEIFSSINPVVPWQRKNDILHDLLRKNPEFFDANCSEGFFMASGAFRNISDFLLFKENFKAFFDSLKWSTGEFQYAIFPFDISRCGYMYNFAPCLHRIFGLDLPQPSCRPLERLRREQMQMSKSEARILVELVENPDASDEEIGKKIRRSRQCITETRNRFIEDGLMTRIAVPTLISDDFGAIAYVHMRFSPDVTFEKKIEVASPAWWEQSIYTLERNSEVFAVYLFSGFKEYSTLISDFLSPFQESGLLLSDPEVFVVPTENADDIIDSSFGHLVRRILTSGFQP